MWDSVTRNHSNDFQFLRSSQLSMQKELKKRTKPSKLKARCSQRFFQFIRSANTETCFPVQI